MGLWINQSIEFVTRTVVDGSSRIWGVGSRRAYEGGYTLRVVRDV